MTAQPSTPTHAEIIMEMLSAAARFGVTWVDQDDIAKRLYPAGRPAHYAESIRSTVIRLRKLLAERQTGIIAEGGRFALALDMPGVFRPGAGFVRRQTANRPVKGVLPVRHVLGATQRVGR